MIKKKMCPLSFGGSGNEAYYDCQKEKCAWWIMRGKNYNSGKDCAIVIIAESRANK